MALQLIEMYCMGRKDQLNEIETWCEVLGQIQQLVCNEAASASLDSYQRTERLERLKKLLEALNRMKESIKLSPPIAIQPSVETAGILQKLAANVTLEVIGGMRLLHQAHVIFTDKIAAYEQKVQARQIAVDFAPAKKHLADVVSAYKRLGSRKLHEQKPEWVQLQLAQCDVLREKMMVEMRHVFVQVGAAEGVKYAE